MKRFAYRFRAAVAFIMALGLGLWSCTDLTVENENQPDQESALAEPSDVEGLIGSSFLTWWQGTHVAGWGLTIQTIADAYSMSWGNFGMRDNSSEPRIAWNNDPAYAEASNLEYPWYKWYSAISAASDGLAAMLSGVDLGDPGADVADIRAEAFVRFIQGISHGDLGILFDQAFIVDETTDLTQPLTLTTYSDVIDAAVGYLEECIGLCANSFTVPFDWIQIDGFDNTTLAKVSHSFIARFLASKGRTPAERTAAPWSTIVSHIDDGITEAFAPKGDGDYWWAMHMYYSGVSVFWGRGELWALGPADTSGSFQIWANKVVADRLPFMVHTKDLRITEGLDTLEVSINDVNGNLETVTAQLPGLYFKNEHITRLVAGRGTYHQSYYWAWKQNAYGSTLLEPMPDMVMTEMYLLRAEAALNANDASNAAEYINMSRVDIGGLNPATASHSIGSIDDKPDALDDASLWGMLKYEKILEGLLTHPYVPYADRRGHGDMVTGTPTNYPIPGKELEILLMESYTFGGVGNAGNPGTAPKERVRGDEPPGYRIPPRWVKFDPDLARTW